MRNDAKNNKQVVAAFAPNADSINRRLAQAPLQL